jgi:hypothetical protein
MKWLRKLRGLLGVGVMWGALWGGIGAAIGFVVGLVDPGAWTLANPVVQWALGMGAYGFVSGVGFGGLLALGEGRRTLADLSLRRVALWGVLGSAAVPLLFGALGFFDAGTTMLDVVGAMLVTAGLGGTFAPAAVAVARKAELAAPERAGLLE